MNIIVCVKQVAQIYVQSGFDQVTGDMVTDGLVYTLNPYDEVAVEEALRQRGKAGKGEVTVVTLGPARAEAALRWCLAMGADEAAHILTSEKDDLDPWARASVLADFVRGRRYDLLLFGKEAVDDGMGQVGTLVGELLELPVITAVTRVEVMDGATVKVERALARGDREEAICPVPAALTVDRKLCRPRYPTFPARQASRTKSIEKLQMPALEADSIPPKMETVRIFQPKVKPKRIVAPDSNLSHEERMKFIMTGGMGDKKGGSVAGDPKKLVSSIIDFLKEKQIIGRT